MLSCRAPARSLDVHYTHSTRRGGGAQETRGRDSRFGHTVDHAIETIEHSYSHVGTLKAWWSGLHLMHFGRPTHGVASAVAPPVRILPRPDILAWTGTPGGFARCGRPTRGCHHRRSKSCRAELPRRRRIVGRFLRNAGRWETKTTTDYTKTNSPVRGEPGNAPLLFASRHHIRWRRPGGWPRRRESPQGSTRGPT
jgi:hypothetical protein